VQMPEEDLKCSYRTLISIRSIVRAATSKDSNIIMVQGGLVRLLIKSLSLPVIW
jgi:hypothetical protein